MSLLLPVVADRWSPGCRSRSAQVGPKTSPKSRLGTALLRVDNLGDLDSYTNIGRSLRKPNAHIRHPWAPGGTLCGKPPCSFTPCQDCASKYESMTRVHVQSTRRPDLAFCGAALHGPRLYSVHLGHLDESALELARSSGALTIAYVTASQARGMVGRPDPVVSLHGACVLNLGRFLGRIGAMDDMTIPGLDDGDGDGDGGNGEAAPSNVHSGSIQVAKIANGKRGAASTGVADPIRRRRRR